MSGEEPKLPETLALSTKVEEDFVAPLTAVRGALEILRDFPDLSDAERERFISTALQGCARLAKGIDGLAESVYAAGRRVETAEAPAEVDDAIIGRLNLDRDNGIAEVDLSEMSFESSKMVNRFYDAVEQAVVQSGRKWFFLIDQTGLGIWPEAWVAFAHREKRLRVNASLGTARYDAESGQVGHSDPSLFDSRDAAVAVIERARKEIESG